MSDFATKYAMKKRMAKGGMACADCAAGSCMAHGGAVESDSSGFSDDMVSRIMNHRYAKGGEVGEPVADFEKNDFDRMDQIGPLDEANYTGANSGDFIGKEDDDNDMVGRIMKSRKKAS